jgi:hypothetical protein
MDQEHEGSGGGVALNHWGVQGGGFSHHFLPVSRVSRIIDEIMPPSFHHQGI